MVMTLLLITHAGNPPKIAGDDLSTSDSSSGSQLKGSTKTKAGTGSAKSLSPTLQPSVAQVKVQRGKKATRSVITSPPSDLSQPSSATQLRALNRKKTTGSVTSPPESAPLIQPPSGTHVRAPEGKKVTRSATISPCESTSVAQQPSGAQDKRKKTVLSRPLSGTQVRAPEGKKVTQTRASKGSTVL